MADAIAGFARGGRGGVTRVVWFVALEVGGRMLDRENIVGYLLLGVCLIGGGVLVYAIATGMTLRYTGPGWLGALLAVVFIGATLFGLTRGGHRWPSPRSGRRGWRGRWGRRDDR